MSTTLGALRRHVTARPGRLLAGGTAALALASALAGCGGGTEPAPQRTTTITVTPTPSLGASTPTTSSATSSTSTTTAPAQPPATYDDATRLFAGGRVDAAVQRIFTSPTGNIFCSIATGTDVPAGCELKEGRVAAPADLCPAQNGATDIGRIEWTGGAPKPICNTDSIYQVGAIVLQYGAIAAMSGSPYQCLSKEFGVTCIDTATRKGFFLAKNTYITF